MRAGDAPISLVPSQCPVCHPCAGQAHSAGSATLAVAVNSTVVGTLCRLSLGCLREK